MRKRSLALTLTLFSALAGTASAGTFLNLVETNSSLNDYVLTNNAGLSNTLSVTNVPFLFTFSVPNTLGTSQRSGLFNFTATTSSPASINGGNYLEGGWSGNGTIFDTLSGTVAFQWSFGPTGSFTGAVGGGSATFNDSKPPVNEVIMTSPYFNFATSVSESFSFGFTSGTPAYIVGAGGFLANATGSGVGTFDATPLPLGAPEPATVFLLGAALVGVALAGRKRLAR